MYRATDAAFGREVAVKVLLDRYAPTSGTARRFADEARITGQLQHPGVPPVFDLGTLPDGRPFLAMKLIKGDTLDELVKADSDRGRLVGAFEQMCQAVAYAHAHGVVHRDLKPQNVMVGAFGEVQVMDWGLAKVLGDRPAPSGDPEVTASDTAITSARDSEDLLTQTGAVLGTPAYMPPEQAIGAVHEIDARSDVFGLGGILAAVLTGRPPFLSATAQTTRVMAARGEVGECFGRLDACGADPELVALAKRCLSPRREDRPTDAGEVARAVAALRAAADDRARRAELDRVKAEGERAAAELQAAEQRRRRRALISAVAVVVLVLVAGIVGTSVGLFRAEEARRAESAQRQEAEAALIEKEKARAALARALEAEQKALAEADASYTVAREATVSVTYEVPEVLRQALFARKAQERVVTTLTKTLDEQIALANARNQPDSAMHALMLRMGDLHSANGKWADCRKAYSTAAEISKRLLRTDEARKEQAKLLHSTSLWKLGILAGDGDRDTALALTHFAAAEKLQREVLERPGPSATAERARTLLGFTLHDTARTRFTRTDYPLARKVAAEAVKLREEVANLPPTRDAPDPQNRLAGTYALHGKILLKLGQDKEGERAMTKAIDLYTKLLERDPDDLATRREAAEVSRELCDRLLDLRRFADVRVHAERDLKLTKELLWTPELSYARYEHTRPSYRLGLVELHAGNREAALKQFRHCVELRRELVEARPTNTTYKLMLAGALARAEEHEEAVRLVEQELKSWPWSFIVAIDAVTVDGVSADAVLRGRPEKELTAEEKALRAKYLDQALTHLERGVTWHYKDVVRLTGDPDFDPIRNQPRFQKALQTVKDRIAADEGKK